MRLRYQGDKNNHAAYGDEIETRREWLPKHYGESLIVSWRGEDYVLGAGTSDSVEFWRDLDEPERLYAYTYNSGLGYIALDTLHAGESGSNAYVPEYRDPATEFFSQMPENLKTYGVAIEEMHSPNAIRYLVEMGVTL